MERGSQEAASWRSLVTITTSFCCNRMNINTNTNTNYKYNLWSKLKLPSVNISIYNPIFIGVQEVCFLLDGKFQVTKIFL